MWAIFLCLLDHENEGIVILQDMRSAHPMTLSYPEEEEEEDYYYYYYYYYYYKLSASKQILD
jgi:hypothetical protein